MPVLLKDIRADLIDFGRTPSKYPKLPMKVTDVVPMVGVKSITFKTIVKGSSGKNYTTYVQFHGVDFSNQEEDDIDTPIMVKGKEVYYARPSIGVNPVMVFCNCPDFRFRFSKPLYDEKGLIGMWQRYKKVPGSNRGPVNPDNNLGFCKHINSVVNKLVASGMIIK